MKIFALATLAALVLAPIGIAQAQTQAQNGSASTPASSAKKTTEHKKPVKKAQPTKKHVTKKKTIKQIKKAEVAVPAQTLTERLSSEELALAPKVYTGDMSCEMGQNVDVVADDQHPGFFRVTTGKRVYYMHPVVSQTGAVRLEDNRVGAVWLQLGNKSMLLDQSKGVVDGCAGPVQRDYAAHMADHPAPDLLGLSKK